MIKYNEFDFSNFCLQVAKKKDVLYSDNIFTLDVETSSYFIKDNKTFPFDFEKPPQFYKDCIKTSLLYIWQFGIDNNVIYGRDLQSLLNFYRN